MNIVNKNKNVERQIAGLKCILSPVTKQVIDGMIKDALKGCPVDKDIEYTIDTSNYSPGSINSTVCVKNNDAYDWLMNHPETSISNDITAIIYKNMTFVSHKFTNLNLKIIVYCDLPEEDFKTLDMLGKVHRSLSEPEIKTSIFCEI